MQAPPIIADDAAGTRTTVTTTTTTTNPPGRQEDRERCRSRRTDPRFETRSRTGCRLAGADAHRRRLSRRRGRSAGGTAVQLVNAAPVAPQGGKNAHHLTVGESHVRTGGGGDRCVREHTHTDAHADDDDDDGSVARRRRRRGLYDNDFRARGAHGNGGAHASYTREPSCPTTPLRPLVTKFPTQTPSGGTHHHQHHHHRRGGSDDDDADRNK